MSTLQRLLGSSIARQWLWLAALAAVAIGAGGGCERSWRQAASEGPAAAPQRSPRATIEQLLAARANGSYQAMGAFIVPGCVHEVIKTLMAVDAFLQANRALCNHVRDEISLGLAQSIDHEEWGAHLDIFSRYVELVDEWSEGETATVSFMVDGRLPLRRARLMLVDGQWRYDPEGGYDPQLPAAFERMAQGLRLMLDDLRSGRVSREAILENPERLIEEVRVRLLPGVGMLPPPPATQPEDG